MSKDINNKLKEFYPDTPMGDWMLRYERISYHELAQNRNIKPTYEGVYKIISYKHGGTLR